MSKNIGLIAAADINGCVGKSNKLPWNLPSDLRMFKILTQGTVVVMGWNTYASIGLENGLPNRTNIVIVPVAPLEPGPVCIKDDINFLTYDDAIEYIESCEKDVWVIGGPKTWDLFKDVITHAVITRVHANIGGDAYLSVGSLKHMRLDSMYAPDAELCLNDEYNYTVERYFKREETK